MHNLQFKSSSHQAAEDAPDSDIERLLEQCLLFLEKLLTPSRLQHSRGVMEVMTDLAAIYSLDRGRAMTAGLLHDAARDLAPKAQLTLVEEAGIALHYPCERHPVYLHARAGAHLVSRALGITDEGTLDAIAAHSYARRADRCDGLLSWCLRAADLVASRQEWAGRERLRSVVYRGKIQEAALLQCGWLIEYLQEQGVPVHPNLLNQFEALSAELETTESFFVRW
jgi:predicted HD superfamily hydrolase involved in NAD metabolism